MEASKLERCLKIPEVAGTVFNHIYVNDPSLRGVNPDKAKEVFMKSIRRSPDYRLTVANAFLAENPDYEVPPELLRPDRKPGYERHGQAHAADSGAQPNSLASRIARYFPWRR